MIPGCANATRAALPFDVLASIGVPLALDNSRYNSVNLAQVPSVKTKNPPNALLAVGQIRWLQDTAHDSFSKGESIWHTLLQVVRGQKEIFKSPSSPDGIPTVRVVSFRGHWHAVDTRRLLVYKVLFHPDQAIPVCKIEYTQEAEGKAFRHKRRDDGNTIELKLRLHSRVPQGICNQTFIRKIVSLVDLNIAPCGLETAIPKQTPLETAYSNGSDHPDARSSVSCLQMKQRPQREHEEPIADQQPLLKPLKGQCHDWQPQSQRIPGWPRCFMCLPDEARKTAKRQEADGRKCPYCRATPMGLWLPEAPDPPLGAAEDGNSIGTEARKKAPPQPGPSPARYRPIAGHLPKGLLELLREGTLNQLWPDQVVAAWKEVYAQAAAARDTAIVEGLDRIGQCFADPVEAKCVARAWDVVDEALAVMPASTSMKKLAVEVRNVFVCVLYGAEQHTRDSFLAAACAAFGRCPLGHLVESRLLLAYATLFRGVPGVFELKSAGRCKRPARQHAPSAF